MKEIVVKTNSGGTIRFDVPRGVNGHLCLRALRKANSGEDMLGLTARESEFVADMVAQIQAANEEAGCDERAS